MSSSVYVNPSHHTSQTKSGIPADTYLSVSSPTTASNTHVPGLYNHAALQNMYLKYGTTKKAGTV